MPQPRPMPQPRIDTAYRRRALLGAGSCLAIASAIPGCRTPGGTEPDDTITVNLKNLPAHTDADVIEADYPTVEGSTPGYVNYPKTTTPTVSAPPGRGSTFTAMVPSWSAIVSTQSNPYTDRLDEVLGARVVFQRTPGNDYIDRQSAVFAAPNDVADWVSVFGWAPPPRFDEAVQALFEDLTPFLGGEKIARWPNLANLPSAAWRFGMYAGKVYGLPVPGEIVTDAIFYRTDIFAELGLEQPHTAEEFLTCCAELTDPGKNRWALNSLETGAPNLLFGAPPQWRERDGNLEYRWETQEYRDALEFQIELFERGFMHPDVVADSGDAKQRFESGHVAITYDGIGSWGQSRATLRDANPDFGMSPMSALSAHGGKPVRYIGAAANFFSFLKKTHDKARIEELLGIANYLAAPFGSKEWEIVNHGVEGVHFTRDDSGAPIPTEQLGKDHPGVLATLVAPPVGLYSRDDPEYVREYCEWMASETEYMVADPFHGYQIQMPVRFATLDQPLWDLESDVVRGRASLADFDRAVTRWRNSGGDDMRAYYQEVLSMIAEQS